MISNLCESHPRVSYIFLFCYRLILKRNKDNPFLQPSPTKYPDYPFFGETIHFSQTGFQAQVDIEPINWNPIT